MKQAMTVLGPVDADQLGHILPHEHILMQFPHFGYTPLYPELVDKKVTLDILGRIRRNIWSCEDNLRLDEPDVAVRELASFKAHGGGTVVDVTPVGLGRDVRAVREVAARSGVHVVVGTGYYIQAGHPPEVSGLSMEEIERWMVRELQVGIDDTGTRAGIIKVSVSAPMHPDEEKVLRAATHTQRETGAPLSVHQYGGSPLLSIDALLREEGASPTRVILCHMCSVSAEQRAWAADQGYYVEIDGFGNDHYTDARLSLMTRDPDRIKMVKELVQKGHVRQVLVSNDVGFKILLKRYGGWSYEHIIVDIGPFMLREGLPVKAIDTMLYYNPMRVIAYLGG